MFDSTQMALLQKPQQRDSDFKEVEREGKRNKNTQSNALSINGMCISPPRSIFNANYSSITHEGQ